MPIALPFARLRVAIAAAWVACAATAVASEDPHAAPAAAHGEKPAAKSAADEHGQKPAEAKAAAPKVAAEKPAAEKVAAEKAPAEKSASEKAPAAAHGKVVAEAAPAVEPAAAPKAPMKDPLDRVRERLAEKLGATKPADAGPQVVRIAAHAEPPAPAVRSAPARRAPAPAAATHVPAAALVPVAETHMAAAHWDYQGDNGPQNWGAMKPEFARCSSGSRQSPIDIRDGIKVQLEPVQFSYQPSGFRVIDNGHTIQVDVSPGNTIEVTGRRYELVQFHFHRPSEERIGGRQFDMVAHLVHKDLDGRLAVIAVLLDRGSVQPIIQTVWNNLPLEKGDSVAGKGTIDLNALLPAERSYFTYMGSLTTPPCSEGVLWMVMKNPVQLSANQISIFARLYPMNARPIQQVAGRLIKESE